MVDQITIKITKRRWYEWLLWALWLFLEIFLVQNAIASGQELEPRAAVIFWASFVVLLLVGVIVWYLRRARVLK